MIKTSRRTFVRIMIALGVVCRAGAHAGDWSKPVEIRHELERCVSFRAKQSGPFLVVHATLGAGWHTFAIDNKQRAAEKLAGRQSLGIDLPTEISVTGGLEVVGPWYQSLPKEFSKPELRWFSWGFENQALFVARVQRSGPEPAHIAIRGQACTETTCKNIDVAISLALSDIRSDADASDIDFKALIQARTDDSSEPRQ